MNEKDSFQSDAVQKTGSINTETELKLIRDQVDVLQVQITERKKPWHKNATTIISVISLLVSSGTALYVQWGKEKDLIRSRKEELRRTLALVIDLRADYENRVVPMKNEAIREKEASFINQKRTVYLQAAEQLANTIPQYISESEYNVLAWEATADMNYKQAENYYNKALEASTAGLSRSYALKSLGVFYSQPGPWADIPQARSYFQKAVDQLESVKASDSNLTYTLGSIYQVWAIQEFGNNFKIEGKDKIAMARKYFSDLPSSDQRRLRSLQVIDEYGRELIHRKPQSPEEILFPQ